MTDDFIITATTNVAKVTTKFVNEKVDKALIDSGLGTEKEKKVETDIVYKEYVWYETAVAMKYLLMW